MAGGVPELSRALAEIDLARRLGRAHEAAAALKALLRRHPGCMEAHERLIALYLDSNDHEQALRQVERALAVQRGSSTLRWRRVWCLRRLGRRRAVVPAVQAALRGDPTPARRLEAIEHLVDAGAFAAALRVIATLRGTRLAVDGEIWRARLDLWRGRPAAAERRLLALPRKSLPARRAADIETILAGVAALSGHAADALAHADRALAIAPRHSEALVWRCEALRWLGRHEEAIVVADAAAAATEGYGFHAALVRVLAILDGSCAAGHGLTTAGVHGAVARQIAAALPGSKVPEMAPPSEMRDFLEKALRRFGGNRTSTVTVISSRPPGLRRATLIEDPRHAARMAQELVRVREADQVLARLDALAARYPDATTVPCHRGEIQLWLGRWDGARRDFERALAVDPQTRWAYIGLAALEVGRGDLQAALAACARAVDRTGWPPGRTFFVYRGEAHRRLGHDAEARADLDQALRLNPDRLAARLNAALLDLAAGDARAATALLDHLRARAPGLLLDAAEETGVVAPDPPALARFYEHMLTMMRGNRSSSLVTYFTAAGALRFLPRASA